MNRGVSAKPDYSRNIRKLFGERYKELVYKRDTVKMQNWQFVSGFAAPDEVPQLFALVAEQLPVTEARDLILYFENTNIGRVLPGGGIQAPLFPISMWNYYLETPFGLPRTNNAVKPGIVLLTVITQVYGNSAML